MGFNSVFKELNLFLTHIIPNTTGITHLKTSMNFASSVVLGVLYHLLKIEGIYYIIKRFYSCI